MVGAMCVHWSRTVELQSDCVTTLRTKSNVTEALGQKDQASSGGRMPLWHLPIPILRNEWTYHILLASCAIRPLRCYVVVTFSPPNSSAPWFHHGDA
eukprot:1156524-Pelagomonas_calceolata.AAC.3